MLSNLWGREPVMILGLLQSAIAVGVAFGLHLTGEQIGAVLALSAATLAVVTRSQVTAPANMKRD